MVIRGKAAPLSQTARTATAEVKKPFPKRDPILDMYDSEGILGARPGMAKDGEKQVSIGTAALIMKREALGKEWEKLCEKPADPIYRMTMSRRMDALGGEIMKKGEKRRVALIDRSALAPFLTTAGVIGGIITWLSVAFSNHFLLSVFAGSISVNMIISGIIVGRELERQMEKAVEDSKLIAGALNELANGKVFNSAILTDIKDDADLRKGLHELAVAGYSKAWELEKMFYQRKESNPLESDFAQKAELGFASEAKPDFTGKA